MNSVIISILFLCGLFCQVSDAEASGVLCSSQTDSLTESQSDSSELRDIFDHALTQSSCYQNLHDLCKNIGPRLSGSAQAAEAVEWAVETFENMGVDTVFLQPVMVPHWVRGNKETGTVHIKGSKSRSLNLCALGGSVGTGRQGIRAKVIEVHNFEQLAQLGREQIEGRIVFFNRPMDPKLIRTMHAYGGCVDQRVDGASEASVFGAVGVLVRSMNLRADDLPHTGVMYYEDSVTKIPAAAISTNDADMLSKALKVHPQLEVSYEMSCETLPDVLSYNVIAEIRGEEYPDQIILVGGHLDSWDLAEGAQDDGAGCVQSIEVLNNYIQRGVKPSRTIRCVLFMNEENGGRGGTAYAQRADSLQENHILSIESDRGGFTPRGFSFDGNEPVREFGMRKIRSWAPLFKPYNLHFFEYGYSGADVGKLKDGDGLLIGFVPDDQRYFDFHHAANDVFEAVNRRELELGAASMTALVRLVDKYGLVAPQLPDSDY